MTQKGRLNFTLQQLVNEKDFKNATVFQLKGQVVTYAILFQLVRQVLLFPFTLSYMQD